MDPTCAWSAQEKAGQPVRISRPTVNAIIYASTHLGSPDCPPAADRSAGYVWAIYKDFDIFSAKPDGTDMKRLTNTVGYDAEATISPDGKKIIFTSTRDGDIDLYEMNIDGSNPRRLTNDLGYDGGAFYSQDNQWIVWRANRPKTADEVKTYKDLLARDLVMPSKMEIMIMKADGYPEEATHFQWRRQFRSVLPSKRQADRLFVRYEQQGSGHTEFRSVSHQSRRLRPAANHLRRRIRRIPDVRATMGRNLSGHPAGMAPKKATSISSLPTGSTEKS